MGAFALFALAQLSSFVHGAVVHHERCAEHGELVDVAYTTPRAAALGGRDTTDTLLASAGEGEHDHCSLLTTPSNLTSVRALVHVTSLAAPLAVVVVAPAPVLLADDVLVDAPKQGPPLRAV